MLYVIVIYNYYKKEIKKMKTMMNAAIAVTVLCASTFGAPLSKEKRVSTFSIASEL